MLIFAVLRQRLLQRRETEGSFYFDITVCVIGHKCDGVCVHSVTLTL